MSGRNVKDFSDDFLVEDTGPAKGPQQVAEAQRESDPHRLAQRQKQIDLGKNTLGYQAYRQAVTRDLRNKFKDPITPDVYQMCSKRAFEGQVKKWRRMLHVWDPPGTAQGAGEPAGPSSNPLAPEASDDFEHISHADAEQQHAGSSARSGSKNGVQLRPLGNLPLKIPSAMRKRQFDETMVSSENRRPQHPRQQQQQAVQQAPPPCIQPDAKHQRRAVPAAAVPPPSEQNWAEQRYEDPELDYGESDDEGGWQHVRHAKQGQELPGEYKRIFNNFNNDWNEGDIQV